MMTIIHPWQRYSLDQSLRNIGFLISRGAFTEAIDEIAAYCTRAINMVTEP